LPEVIRIGTDILRGLEYLHGQNLFHNDVKPENVLIGPYSQGMLSDYGIVGISTDGAPVPPPDTYKIHTAPEVLNSNAISAQTDLFQTGMTLFRMLVGLGSLRDRFLRLGELQYYQAICSATLITDADFPPYVPARLRRIILKAICPDVKGRYVSALEMRRDLERLNFKGCWTVTPAGTFIGHDSTHEFRFEHNRGVGNRYSVTAFKKSKATQRETRVARFSAASLTGAQSERLIAQFVKFVVEGK
jgi:serine/threonine protein kinase